MHLKSIERMALNSGTRLGPYEIQSALGAGGMGEVYRARDTRLDRIVAIKILPAELAGDAVFRERFEREGRAIAALNHPNICALYDVGEAPGPRPPDASVQPPASIRFLVMEYLEGETLARRLERGPLPIDHALKHAADMVDALDKAHRRGVVHRDLKPGNVILTKSGAKLLDFGLARLDQRAPTTAFSASSAQPTEADNLTAQGTILGTLQYMAPEQVEGKEADARTDIFALGTVLYEMVTGRKAFEGRSHAALIGAILEREPIPISSLDLKAPPGLDAIVRRCLAKDPEDRWQSAGDLAVGLKWFLEPALEGRAALPGGDAGVSAGSMRRQRLWMALAGILGLTTIALFGLQVYQRESPVTPAPVRFPVFPPDSGVFQTPILSGSAAPVGGSISPDGRLLAFTATDSSGKVLLWVRPLDSLGARPLPGTDGAALPFWSPDSRTLGFFAQGRLKKVNVSDGSPHALSDVARGQGGTWNRDGVILFAPDLGAPLSRIEAAGGEPRTVTTLGEGQQAHRFPCFLPDGRHFLYYAEGSQAENTGVFVDDLNGSASRRVLAADSAAVYAPSGHLLFVRQGILFAQIFDPATLQTAGDPVPIAESVPHEGTAPAFSVSETRVLTYRKEQVDQQFAWFDRSGQLVETVGEPGPYRGVDLSPDGTRIAVHRHDGTGGDIWVFEPRGIATRVTFDAAQDNSSPIWSPDGNRVVFGSRRNGRWGLYRKRADETAAEELLVESDLPKIPASFSQDGHYLVYWLLGPGAIDQWLLPVTGGGAGESPGVPKPVPLLSSRFVEGHAQVSPDGKWIAYVSNPTGRLEVYVRAFPSGEQVERVSATGGVTPRWRRDGKELFYVSAYDAGKLTAVEVREKDGRFVPGTPRELFDVGMTLLPHSTTIPPYHSYAVSADGQRFLIPRPVSGLQGDIRSTPITVVLNWTAALR